MKKHLHKHYLFLFLLLISLHVEPLFAQESPDIIFVNEDATGNNTGESWENAFTNLQNALNVAASGDQIWVAAGEYKPTDNDADRSATFQLIDGVELYGGFIGNGSETEVTERDWGINRTILSGDIDDNDLTTNGVVTDTDDITGNNSYHVVTASGTSNATVLDGFVITGGMANNSGISDGNRGGGLFLAMSTNLVMSNLTFRGNSAVEGGAIYSGVNQGLGTDRYIKNTLFENNTAETGGAIYSMGTHMTILNTSFIENEATGNGGAMTNESSAQTLTNVTYSGNSAGADGGAMYNVTFRGSSETHINNSILWGNSASESGNEIFNEGGGSATLNYSLFSNDTGDIIEGGGFTVSNSITDDPQFTDPATGDYSLEISSTAINSGNNLLYTDASGNLSNDLDLAGNPRVFKGSEPTIDMGAFEFQGEQFLFSPDQNNILYVNIAVDTEAEGYIRVGNSWANAIPELHYALTWADENWSADLEGTLRIWVAKGTYHPTADNTDRNATFELQNNVEIYGGFEGVESTLDERNWQTNLTILSGDIDNNDVAPNHVITDTDNIAGNNSYHVATASETDLSAVLDGFTITAGLADDGSSENGTLGAGLFLGLNTNVWLSNLTFSGNMAEKGGGLYSSINQSLETDTHINNTLFIHNTADTGGAIYARGALMVFINSAFIANEATSNGGALLNEEGNLKLTNSTFSANNAIADGGAIYNLGSRGSAAVQVNNSIIWGNNATGSGNEVFNNGNGTASLDYSLYSNNSGDVIQGGGFSATNSITVDPEFSDPAGNNYSLLNFSPAINTGSNQLYTNAGGTLTEDTDLKGNPRVFQGSSEIIDMGAYEFQDEPAVIEFTQSFDAPSTPGSTVSLEFTITNNQSRPFTALSFTNDLDAGLSGLTAIGLPMSDICGAGSQLSGTSLITLTGGTLAAESSCTFDVTLQIPDGASPGTYPFTSSPLNGSGQTIADPATTRLVIELPIPGNNERVLASNRSDYVFTPSDFSPSDNDYFIHLEGLSSDFKGTLELNGNEVSVGNKISVEDINNGQLSYIPPAGEYGFKYDSFDFKVGESENILSGDTYTMTIDLAATSVTLTGENGWRFLTSPASGNTYDDFLTGINIQGIPGSFDPGASFPTLYELDQKNYQWSEVSDMNNTIQPGKGFIVSVSTDDLPVTLVSDENWIDLDGSYTYNTLYYDPEQGEEGNSHFLIANPHPISLNFCDFSKTNIATSVVFWDPAENAGNGGYLNINCAVDDVHIAPFQAFWIRTTDSAPSLSIPEEAYLSSQNNGHFKQQNNTERSLITFNASSAESEFSNSTSILFSEEGSYELDAIDAPKMSPAGLAERYFLFYSLDAQNREYAFRSLPLDVEDQISIPLDFETTESGTFILSWNLPDIENLYQNYVLRDNQTRELIKLNNSENYSFEIESNQQTKSSEKSRFTLLVTSSDFDGSSPTDDLPNHVSLNQNYPNPFNPTTVISYELPKSTHVSLEVYDMAGRQVVTLVNSRVTAGRHSVNFDASDLSSGVYMYRLQAGSNIITKKLTVVK